MPDPSAILHALSDPTRRRLFEALMTSGEASVSALTAVAGVSQPAVSKHLMILRDAGLANCQTSGRQSLYSPSPDALVPLVDWLAAYRAFWEGRLDRLENTLDRMDR